MKAITIHQPWASLIAAGFKTYETRSRATRYRGLIAIHAGAKQPLSILGKEDYHLIREAAVALGNKWSYNYVVPLMQLNNLPRGAIIAIARVVDCWNIVVCPGTDVDTAKHIPIGGELNVSAKHPRFGEYIVPSEQERLFGDWDPGRFAWQLELVEAFETPVPVKGRQGLWTWYENN